MATTSECITFFDSNGGGNIMKGRAFKTADAARPNQTFEEGHVCILRAVTRATLIFLYRMVVVVIAIRLQGSIYIKAKFLVIRPDYQKFDDESGNP